MRIAYVCADPGVPVFGRKGCSVHVQEMIDAMRRAGHAVTLFARRTDGVCPDRLNGLPVQLLPALPGHEPAEREIAAYEQNPDLAQRIEDAGPFDLVYERHALWSFGALERARRLRIPSVLEINAPLIAEQQRHRYLHHVELAERAARTACRHADHIVAVSPAVTAYARKLAPGHPSILVEPNGVNVARFRAVADRTPELNAPFTVGFVGTLKPWHGLSFLLAAFARLLTTVPDARLLLVGEGPERPALQAEAHQLGLGARIEFTGAVDPADIPAWLAEMDVAVAPYPPLDDFYFSPLKVLEYMAAGRAVVASRIGEIPDWIDHDLNGWLVTPGDVPELAASLAALARNPERRACLGAAARALVASRHDWLSIWNRIEARVARPPATLVGA